MDNITVTSPLLPNLDELNKLMQDIWNRKWITNMGHYHELLEAELAKYLGVEYISLFTNGTLPLITALQALGLTKGEVITTPYSFVATTHSIWWNQLTPVFVDIEEETCGMDPAKIEAAITPNTVAIMPVHCYGKPCKTKEIDAIAKKHGLKVIYDAAHAFGVKVKAREGAGAWKSILDFGDISTLSFHATKVYNTIEGGALVCHTKEMKEKIDHLKNFGFEDEVTVVAPGINSKMDEVRAAYGLLNLKQVDAAIEARQKVAKKYVEGLRNIPGVRLFKAIEDSFSPLAFGEGAGERLNYSYFPIFINEEEYGMSRDALYEKMKAQGIFSRRYFYPLISTFEPYREYPTAAAENLPIATKVADQVLCLPMHHALSDEDITRIISIISSLNQ